MEELLSSAELDAETKNSLVAATSWAAAQDIISTIDKKVAARKKERQAPGTTQRKLLNANVILIVAGDSNELVEVDRSLVSPELAEIVTKGEKLVYESGVKANFRDNKSRWHGHVSVKVYC